MRPDDPVKQPISEPFDGAPALADAWEVMRGTPHPTSFRFFDQTDGSPHCCDFMFVTEDLASRLQRIVYDQQMQSSDHQPILVELAA